MISLLYFFHIPILKLFFHLKVFFYDVVCFGPGNMGNIMFMSRWEGSGQWIRLETVDCAGRRARDGRGPRPRTRVGTAASSSRRAGRKGGRGAGGRGAREQAGRGKEVDWLVRKVLSPLYPICRLIFQHVSSLQNSIKFTM